MESRRGEELLKRLEELRKAVKETQSRIEDLKEVIKGCGKRESVMIDKDAGKISPLECPHYFGYLKPAKNVPIDDFCLTCPKLIECIKAEVHIQGDKPF
ncbi:MAG: hypothetical protein U9O89_03415 [Thermoproteota archaeon]|nr:hypothetical protein [Thermoproteota archaeon]